MNRLKRIIGIYFTLIILSSCGDFKLTHRVDINKDVIVRINKKRDIVTAVHLPFILRIENKSITKKEFGRIIYNYGYNDMGANIILYENDKKLTNNKLKTVQRKKIKDFFIYSVHFIDPTNSTQQELRLYLDKMLKLNQDTLHVGTVEQFKQKHPELFKMITENDTISIRYLKNKNSGLGERIAIPANW